MKRWRAIIIPAVVAMLSSGGARAVEKFVTRAAVEKRSAILTIFDAPCADNPECVVATLSCADLAGFKVFLTGIETKAAGSWLRDAEGKAVLVVDARKFALRAEKLQYGEMDGAWEVDLGNIETVQEAWQALAKAHAVTLTAGPRKLTIPADRNLEKVAKACAR
jgi:hypothetical protein